MATGYSGSINLGSDSYRGSLTIGSDELMDFSCTPCYVRQAITVQAEYFCSDCDEFCCKSCQDVHNSFRFNRSHKVFGRDQLPLEICPDHPGETLKLICLHDNVLCCSVCASLSHRTCPGMTYIPTIAKGIHDSHDLSIVDNTLDLFIKFAEEIIQSDEKANTSLDQSKTNYLDTLTKIRQQVDDFFSNLESKANIEMNKFHAEKTNELQQHKKAVNDIKDKLTQNNNAIQASSTNNESQLFIKMFTAQQILPDMTQQLQKLAESPQTANFYLDKDKNIQEIFNTIESLGKIKDDTTTIQRKLPNIKPLPLLELKQLSPQPQPPQQQQSPQPTPRQQQQSPSLSSAPAAAATTTTTPSGKTPTLQQNRLYTATNGRDINVKIKSDNECCGIYGSCQMPNCQILLTDNNNQKVKRLNTMYELTDYVDVPASPLAVCCMGDAEAVVTCDNNTIYFLSITERKMAVTRSIQLDHECYGIANNKGHIFVSDNNNKVYIYTTSGQRIKTLQKNKNGANLFSATRYICVSPDGSKIYVCDRDKGSVTLDSEGNHLSTYNSNALEGAYGVCVDRQGRVLVCGWGSDNVLQLDDGGTTRMGHVVGKREGIYSPRSVCIDNHNSTLIVGMHGRFHIKVFDLK